MFRTIAIYILTFGRVPRQPRIISRSAHMMEKEKDTTSMDLTKKNLPKLAGANEDNRRNKFAT